MKSCGALVICALVLFACSSSETFTPWSLDTLTPQQGFSIRIPQFEVPAGHESQNCYFMKVPDINSGADVWINKVVTAINPGSHHVNLFRVRSIIKLDPAAGTPIKLGEYDATVIEGSDDYAHSPCWDSSNWADWPLVANSQHANANDLYTQWNLPDQVALRLVPGETIMIQTHYVNSTDQPTLYGGKVGINLYSFPGTSPIEMGTLFATQQNIRICRSNPDVTYSGTCKFPSGVTVAAANGHFHKRGKEFMMYGWDGASTAHPGSTSQFYDSQSWDDPVMAKDLAVPEPADAGVWWDCAYHWTAPDVFTCADVDAKDPQHQGDCCYTFGGNTDVGEHCNVFLYYYPKAATDVFCN